MQLVLLVTLAACGDDDTARSVPSAAASSSAATSADPQPTTDPTTATPTPTPAPTAPTASLAPVRQAEAERALQEGLRRLLGGGTVDFRYKMRVGPTAFTETTGRSAVAGGWRSSTSFSEELSDLVDDGDEVGDYRMEVRAPGRTHVYMQMVGWPEPYAGCWLQMGPDQVPVGFLAMSPGVPAYVGVLGAVRALGFDAEDDDGSRIEVSLSLRGALLLLTGRTVQALAVPPDAVRGTRVPARVYLEDGVVTDVTVDGADIVEGVRSAGGDADSQYAGYLAALDVTIRYTPAPDGSDPVTAPKAGLVMSAEDMDARRGC